MNPDQFEQSLVDASPVAACIFTGPELTVQAINNPMLFIWGKDRSVLNKTLHDAMPELVGQPFHDLISEVYRTGVPYHNPEGEALLMADGQLKSFYFNYSYKALRNAEGDIYGVMNTALDVTEQVATRRKLAEAEERLNFALNAAEIGTWDLDIKNSLVQWDARCKQLYGFSKDDTVPYDQVLRYMHPDDMLKVNEAVMYALNPASGGRYDIQFRTIGAEDGKVRWLHCKGKAYFDKNYQPYRFSGTAQDISKEKAKNEALRQAREQFDGAFANTAVGVTITNLDGKFQVVNQAYSNITGYTLDELMSNNYSTLTHPDDLPENTKLLDQLLQGAIPSFTITKRYIRKDKSIIWVRMSVSTIKDEGGRPKSYIGVAQDITAEVDAQVSKQKLADEFKFVTNFIPQIVWSATPNGKLDFYNDIWYQYTGLQAGESMGDGWELAMHPDEIARTHRIWNESLATGKPYQTEYRLKNTNGEYHWFLARALPMYDNDGTIIKWFGSGTDIEDYKQLQRQKDDFIGMASHELKTPVTSIKAYSQALEAKFKRSGDPRDANMLSRMVAQINRLTSLIGDLLDVTKVNSNRISFNNTWFDFNELMQDTVQELQGTSPKHRMIADLNYCGEVYADKDRMRQVIINLITNAVKYSPLADKVIIKTERKDDEVAVCVEDFGIGIAADKQAKVFEQFYRVSGDQQHRFQGLGLGLYISSEIIKRQGGRIWVNSIEGKGSTFCFALPALEKAPTYIESLLSSEQQYS